MLLKSSEGRTAQSKRLHPNFSSEATTELSRTSVQIWSCLYTEHVQNSISSSSANDTQKLPPEYRRSTEHAVVPHRLNQAEAGNTTLCERIATIEGLALSYTKSARIR